MAARVSLVTAAASKVGRRNRNPRYNHITVNKPWEITPFFLAPVLAGETMASLLLQQTIALEGIKPTISGWWAETYFFYVKHRDLAERDALTDMHVINTPISDDAANPTYFHAAGHSWMDKCLDRVVREYFRDENEEPNVAVGSTGLPLVKLDRDNWLDSARVDLASTDLELDLLPAESVEMSMYEAHQVPAGYEAHYDTWLQMRRARFIEVDFEDYLKSHGIKVAADKVEPNRPELIRYIKDWQTPRSWSVPTTGEAAAQLRWTMSERADKDRFFTEPGFIIGLNVLRPKVLVGGIKGTALGLLRNAFTWLPAMLNDNPETSLVKIPNADAVALFPAFTGTEDIWFDVKDLFLYGEDYQNFGTVPGNLVASTTAPFSDFSRRYAGTDDIAALTWQPAPIDPGADPLVYPYTSPVHATGGGVAEGVVSLTIKSRITDTSGHGDQYLPAPTA